MSDLIPADPGQVSPQTADQNVVSDVQFLLKKHWPLYLEAYNVGYDIVWTNKNGRTPQQACDALGTSAAKTFRMHGALGSFIKATAALEGKNPNLRDPTWAFTLNGDGTVDIHVGTPYEAE